MRPIVVSVTGIGTTPLARMDEWCPGPVSIQVTVSGTVTYSVQSSNDDPNSPTNPVALGSMTWITTNDTNAANATTSVQTNYLIAPLFIRVNVSTGTGTVTATIVQLGVAPY
jgi:hypothetical protein